MNNSARLVRRYGAAYTVYYSEDGFSFTPVKELVVVGDKAVLFAHLDEKEGTL